MELKEKELILSNKEKEILNLQKVAFEHGITSSNEQSANNDDENSIKKLALKVGNKTKKIKINKNYEKFSQEWYAIFKLPEVECNFLC